MIAMIFFVVRRVYFLFSPRAEAPCCRKPRPTSAALLKPGPGDSLEIRHFHFFFFFRSQLLAIGYGLCGMLSCGSTVTFWRTRLVRACQFYEWKKWKNAAIVPV
jgi:hypothetical protein